MIALNALLISFVATPITLIAFTPPGRYAYLSFGTRTRHRASRVMMMTQTQVGGHGQRKSTSSSTVRHHSNSSASNNDIDNNDALFDPFLQSPLSFGKQTLSNNYHGNKSDGNSVIGGSTREFGFRSAYAESNVVDIFIGNPPLPIYTSSSSITISEVATADVSIVENDALEFDPLLSPHAYANGIAAGPVLSLSSTTPILHTANAQFKQQQSRIGILLIDHGSKRSASNEHIHNVARMYEDRLTRMTSAALDSKLTDTTITSTSLLSTTKKTMVRAAHMEIASPSILDSLRNLFAMDQVTKVICVPYFLSPGRHATEDVPNLINEARKVLIDEGVIVALTEDTSADSSILVSDALGTKLECMLRGVDELVEKTLLSQ